MAGPPGLVPGGHCFDGDEEGDGMVLKVVFIGDKVRMSVFGEGVVGLVGTFQVEGAISPGCEAGEWE